MADVFKFNTLKRTDGFERLFKSATLGAGEATAASSDWDGVLFTNQSDFKVDPVQEPTNVDGVIQAEYKAEGTASVMTEEQRLVYGTATVAGETTFVVVQYADNFKGAKGRRTYWTENKEGGDKIGYGGLKDVNGTEKTVLGISGPGTVNNGAPYWNVDILDEKSEEGNLIAHYVFDFTNLI